MYVFLYQEKLSAELEITVRYTIVTRVHATVPVTHDREYKTTCVRPKYGQVCVARCTVSVVSSLGISKCNSTLILNIQQTRQIIVL